MLGRRNHYDLVVVGGGRSGYRAALCARRGGAKTALVEKNKLGGHEPTSGRALIAHLQDYIAEQPSAPDYSTTRTWLQNDQKRIAQTYTKENLEAEHIDTFFAAATFAGTNRLEVGDTFLSFDKALIATGAQPIVPQIEGIRDIGFITPHQLFESPNAPKHIIFLGYTRLVCEQAQICKALGIKVSIISLSPYLVPREVQESSRFLKALFANIGVDLYLGASVHHLEKCDGQITAHFDRGQGVESIQADQLVLDWGTLSNHEHLDLEVAAIDFGRNGIFVNDYLQTTNPHVFAAGEACTSFHIKQADDLMAYIAVGNALGSSKKKFERRALTRSILTKPEIAHVGLTVTEAQRQDYEVDILHIPYAQQAPHNENGFAQLLLNRQQQGHILGATLAGPGAREVIGHFALGLQNKQNLLDLGKIYYPHESRSAVIYALHQAFLEKYPISGLKKWLPRLAGWLP